MANIGAQLLGEIWENGEPANDNFEIEVNDEDERDGDVSVEGGVAANPEDENNGKSNSSDCDLALDIAPQHPILRPGVTVSIGLDKSTKLSAVFNRYVEVANEAGGTNNKVQVRDLEFVHCHLLNGTDTAEASALMKNDKVKVRKMQAAQRDAEADRKRIHREADRAFFDHLRGLLPDAGGSRTADITLDCQGKHVDENGRNQQVLCTTVRAHSTILRVRCPWLSSIVEKSRREAAAKQELEESRKIPEVEEADESEANIVQRVDSDEKSGDEEDDDGIAVLSCDPKLKEESGAVNGAAEIENDEEDERPYEPNMREGGLNSSSSPVVVPADKQPVASTRRTLLRVTLPDHSPEAVKLLLEYCYTNRVRSLGHEAFVQACKTKPHRQHGPVPPYSSSSSGSRRWPNSGLPQISFSVALQGVALAEQAGLHRLSLMCEIAASQLLTPTTVVEGLSMCTSQKISTGNHLPHLRRAAMDVVLRSGSRGVVELAGSPTFRAALKERRAVIVPPLLQGTTEAVTLVDKSRGVKRDASDFTCPSFEDLDRKDAFERQMERRRSKGERSDGDPTQRTENHLQDTMDFYDPVVSGWTSEAAKRSLSRMTKHMETIASRHSAHSSSRSRSGQASAKLEWE